MPLRNLIDGAGFAQAIKFDGVGVKLQARFVQTQTKVAEDRAKQAIFGGFSQLCPRGLRGHLRGESLRFTANTNLVGHGGKLYALYENDWPYRLSAQNLETQAHDNLGILAAKQRFSAHPKLDAATGDMHNIGCEYTYKLRFGSVSALTRMNFYKTSLAGRSSLEASTELPYPAALVHDMALTPHFAVAVVSPLLLRPTFRVVAGLQPADHAVLWDGALPSLLAVHNRGRESVALYKIPTTLCFHTVNAFEMSGGGIAVDTCDFADGDVVRITADIAQGVFVKQHRTRLRRLQRLSDGSWHSKTLSETPLDWPRLSPGYAGRSYRYIFGNTWDDHSPLPDVPVRVDLQEGKTLRFSLRRPHCYAGEPLPVKKPRGTGESDVYVIGMVYESELASHVLYVWDGANPEAAALCRLQTPSSLPYGFHGNWLDEDDESGCALPW